VAKANRNPPLKNNVGINQVCRGDHHRKECGSETVQTEYHLRKVAVKVSIGLEEHFSGEGPVTYVNRADRHIYAAKIDFLVPNKHCFGA
jgi:hypothetical protein